MAKPAVSGANGGIRVGDSVKLIVVASGCSQGGHFGRVYIDGVGSSVPGPFIAATGPASANADTDITYILNYANGGLTEVWGTHVDMTTPPNTTFKANLVRSGERGRWITPRATIASRCAAPASNTLGPTSTSAVFNGRASQVRTSCETLLVGSSRSPKCRHSARQVTAITRYPGPSPGPAPGLIVSPLP